MNIRAGIAMKITGVNRLRFNEAVAAGFYKCAPTTEYRRSRIFDTPDVIGLHSFGTMLHAGLSHRVAAEIACIVVDNVRSHGDDLEAVIVAWTADGTRLSGPQYAEGTAGDRSHYVVEGGRITLHAGPDLVGAVAPEAAEADWTMMFRFHIPTIGKDVFAKYYALHQAGAFAGISEDESAE